MHIGQGDVIAICGVGSTAVRETLPVFVVVHGVSWVEVIGSRSANLENVPRQYGTGTAKPLEAMKPLEARYCSG